MYSYIYIYKGNKAQRWVDSYPEDRIRFTYKTNDENDYLIRLDAFLNESMLTGKDILIDKVDNSDLALNQLPKAVEEFNKWIQLSPLNHIQYKIEEWDETV